MRVPLTGRGYAPACGRADAGGAGVCYADGGLSHGSGDDRRGDSRVDDEDSAEGDTRSECGCGRGAARSDSAGDGGAANLQHGDTTVVELSDYAGGLRDADGAGRQDALREQELRL